MIANRSLGREMEARYETAMRIVLLEPMGRHASHNVPPCEESDSEVVFLLCQAIILAILHLFILSADTIVDMPCLHTIVAVVLVFVIALKELEIRDSETWVDENLLVATVFLSHKSAERVANDDIDLIIAKNLIDLRESDSRIDREIGREDLSIGEIFADARSRERLVA